MRNANTVLVRSPKGNRTFEKAMRTWEGGIKMFSRVRVGECGLN